MAGLQQESQVVVLQNAVSANGNGTSVDISGMTGAIQLEVAETAGGTATVTVEGSFDGSNWYAAGFQRVDAQASLTRAASGFSVTANLRAVLQVLDPYPQLRARISSVASSPVVSVKAYLVAQ